MLSACRPQQHLIRDIEAHHGDGSGLGEHDCGGLGIGPYIELGGRRYIARLGCAPHDREAAEMLGKRWVLPQRQGHVGERSHGNELEIVDSARHVGYERDGVGRCELSFEKWQLNLAQPGLAVNSSGIHCWRDKGPRRAAVNGHVEVGDLGGDQRIVASEVDSHIAVHGRDAHEIGVVRRAQDRDRVIQAWIAIEQNPRLFGRRLRTHGVEPTELSTVEQSGHLFRVGK